MINIAIIGMGQRGRATRDRLRFVESINVVVECDTDRDWRRVVRLPEVDLVWICTPWEWHATMAVEAMRVGKDVALEVPAVLTIAECHTIVRVARETHRHCIILENCCYDTWHLGIVEMVGQGLFGRIKHLEGAYAHTVPDGWMRNQGRRHAGNPYPTHALGPMCQLLPEGDSLDYIVSLSSQIPGDHTNTSLIRTRCGVSMLLHYDISTPRPYNRMQTVCGVLGYAQKYPTPTIQIQTEGSNPRTITLMGDEAVQYVESWISPKYRVMIDKGRQLGVSNVMNYMMDLRIAEVMERVLANRKDGLEEPSFDMDVYDAALWSSVVELSEQSVLRGSIPVKFPEFGEQGGYPR